jgi:hypothetical protein
MILKFEEELKKFEEFTKSLGNTELEISQAEITYINHITATASLARAEDAFSLLNLENFQPEDFSLNLREVIYDANNQPCGRLVCELSSGLLPTGEKVYLLNLTVRGAPASSKIDQALEFIKRGREVIVQKFTAMTSSHAHTTWGRTK